MNKKDTLLLIDAHAMIHRAFHALPPLSNSKNFPTNAIYGFFLMLQKVLTEFKPSHVVVCFDTPKPTFRKQLFDEYRANRPAIKNELREQIPVIREMVAEGGIQCLEKEGFEADDVIGAVSEKYQDDFNKIIILTGDKDLLQLADKNVFVIMPKKGVSKFDLYSPQEVVERFGVDPEHIPDYKALAGDASDNYNTVKGIGPKTALKLLQDFSTIENLYDNIEKVDNEKWKKLLEEHKEQVLLFKKLATIVTDLDLKYDVDSMSYKGFDEKLKEKLEELELYSLKQKLYVSSLLPETREEEKEKKKTNEGNDDNSQIGLF